MDYYKLCHFINYLVITNTGRVTNNGKRSTCHLSVCRYYVGNRRRDVSSIATMILGLIILICGFSPVQQLSEKLGNPKEGDKILSGADWLGTGNALTHAFSGFSTSAVALVARHYFWRRCKRRNYINVWLY